MRVIYEAFDGTQFEDEDECKDYELDCEAKKVENEIVLLDQYGKVIAGSYANIDFDKVFTIAVGNVEAVELLTKIFDEAGIYAPKNGFKENTVYWWDDEKIEWLNVAEKIAELNEEVEFFEEKLFLLQQM